VPPKRSRFPHDQPIDIQGLHDEELIDLTPELRKEALGIVAKYDYGPLYTPPSQRGTIQIPGVAGGANWSGAAIDPETGMLYVGTYRLPFLVTVRAPQPGELPYDYPSIDFQVSELGDPQCSMAHTSSSTPQTQRQIAWSSATF
jgi:hypothetical protein